MIDPLFYKFVDDLHKTAHCEQVESMHHGCRTDVYFNCFAQHLCAVWTIRVTLNIASRWHVVHLASRVSCVQGPTNCRASFKQFEAQLVG